METLAKVTENKVQYVLAKSCNDLDKIACDDGRCIPAAWCCDRHHDPNCTVMVRPSCCQGLSDSE